MGDQEPKVINRDGIEVIDGLGSFEITFQEPIPLEIPLDTAEQLRSAMRDLVGNSVDDVFESLPRRDDGKGGQVVNVKAITGVVVRKLRGGTEITIHPKDGEKETMSYFSCHEDETGEKVIPHFPDELNDPILSTALGLLNSDSRAKRLIDCDF